MQSSPHVSNSKQEMVKVISKPEARGPKSEAQFHLLDLIKNGAGFLSALFRVPDLSLESPPRAVGLWIDITYLYHFSNSSGLTDKSFATAPTSRDKYFLVLPCLT